MFKSPYFFNPSPPCRVLAGIIIQLLKKFLASFGTRQYIIVFERTRHWTLRSDESHIHFYVALHHHWRHAWLFIFVVNSMQFIEELTLIKFRTSVYRPIRYTGGSLTNNTTWLHWPDRGSRALEAVGHTWIPSRLTAYPSW